ncbi:MAG: leucine-rich repeat protein [Anaerovoracaceae bacterium]
MVKKRKWLGLLMALVMVFAMVPMMGGKAAGETRSEYSDGTWTVGQKTGGVFYIEKYTGPETSHITVPSHVAGHKVSGMESGVFKDKEWLEKVTFETEGEQNIFDAFERSGVKEVVLPTGGEFIFRGSFRYCKNLSKINLEALSKLDFYAAAFIGCTNLKSVQLPSGMNEIIGDLFNDSGLENINFPDSLKEIGNSAFYRAKLKNTPGKTLLDGTTPCLYIPDGVTKIGRKAFLGNDHQYTAVSVPPGLSTEGAFKAGVPVEERKTAGKVTVSYNRGIKGAANEKAGEFPENSTYQVDRTFDPGNVGWLLLGSDGKLNMDKLYQKGDTYQLGTEGVVFYGVKDLDPVMKHPTDAAKNKKVQDKPIYGNYQFPTDVTVTVPEYPSDADWQAAIPGGKVFAGWKHSYNEKVYLPGQTISLKEAFLAPNLGPVELEPQFEALPPPVMTSGDGSTWVKGSGKNLSFTSDGEFRAFEEVSVDGKVLTKDVDYTVAEGSTIVNLKSEYLEKLTLGKHTIGIKSVNGTATGNFTVVAKVAPKPSGPDGKTDPGKTGAAGTVKTLKDGKTPKTGEPSSLGLMAMFMIIGGATALATWKRREN